MANSNENKPTEETKPKGEETKVEETKNGETKEGEQKVEIKEEDGKKIITDGEEKVELIEPEELDIDDIIPEAERTERVAERAKQWSEEFGVEIEVFDDVEKITNKTVKKAIKDGLKVQGWYDRKSGKCGIYTKNVETLRVVDTTYLHEVIGHKGLEELLGKEGYKALCLEVFDNLMTPAERKTFLDYAGVKGDKAKAADEFIQKNFTEKLSKEDVTNFSKEEKLRLEKFLDRIYEYIQNLIKKITGTGSKITKADIVDAIKASAMRLRENAAKAKAEAAKTNAQIGKPKSQKEIIDEHISKFPTKEQLEGMTKEQIIKTLWGEPYKALCSLYRLPFGDNNNLFYDGYSFGPKLTKGYRKDDAITYSRAYMEEIKKRVEQGAEKATDKQIAFIQKLIKGDERLQKAFEGVELTKEGASVMITLLKGFDSMIHNDEFEANYKAIENIASLNKGLEQEGKALGVVNDAVKPIGKGSFGDIFDQFKGKHKEALQFLLDKKGGDLVGVFSREGIGDIDLVWGNKSGGLEHIIEKHVGDDKSFSTPDTAIEEINNIIKNGKETFKDGDKIVLELNRKLVTLRRNVRDKGVKIADKNWVLTAYDINSADDVNSAMASKVQGKAAPATESAGKGNNNLPTDQTKGGKIVKGEKQDPKVLNSQAPFKTKDTDFFSVGLDKKYAAFRPALAKDNLMYKGGYVATSDAYILLAKKVYYDAKYEGKAVNKQGEIVKNENIGADIPIPDFLGIRPKYYEKEIERKTLNEYVQRLDYIKRNSTPSAFKKLDIVFETPYDNTRIFANASKLYTFLNYALHNNLKVLYQDAVHAIYGEGEDAFAVVMHIKGDEATNPIDITTDRLMNIDTNEEYVPQKLTESYTTKKGAKVAFKSLLESEDVSYKAENGNPKLDKLNKLRKLEEGEICNVERRFTERKEYDFFGKEKIETLDDVAYIFKNLEDEAIENTFIVAVKNKRPTIIHTGIGNMTIALLDVSPLVRVLDNIKPDEVYFVHNHPSGNLRPSDSDEYVYNRLAKMTNYNCEGIIINGYSGDYSVFTSTKDYTTLNMNNNRSIYSEYPAPNDVKHGVYSYSKNVFNAPLERIPEPLSPNSIAEFINTQRLGSREKVNVLFLNNHSKCVGNTFLPITDLRSDVNTIARSIVSDGTAMGATSAIIYGSGNLIDMQPLNLSNAVKSISGETITLLDVIQIESSHRSYMDYGVSFNVDMEESTRNINSGIQSLHALANGEDVVTNAMYRGDLQQYGGDPNVNFYLGEPGNPNNGYKGGYGILHIASKHGFDSVLKAIDLIAKAPIIRSVEGNKTVVIGDKDYEVVLALTRFGNKESWVLSGWNVKESAGETGEVSAQTSSTQTNPTFSREDLGAALSEYKSKYNLKENNTFLKDNDIDYIRGGGYGERENGQKASSRALDAESDGTFSKGSFRVNYNVSKDSFNALKELGIIDGNEWHHTGKNYRVTDYFSWEDSYRTTLGNVDYSNGVLPEGSLGSKYESNKKAIDKLAKEAMTAKWGNNSFVKVEDNYKTFVHNQTIDMQMQTPQEAMELKQEHNKISQREDLLPYQRRELHKQLDDIYFWNRINRHKAYMQEHYEDFRDAFKQHLENASKKNAEIEKQMISAGDRGGYLMQILNTLGVEKNKAYDRINRLRLKDATNPKDVNDSQTLFSVSYDIEMDGESATTLNSKQTIEVIEKNRAEDFDVEDDVLFKVSKNNRKTIEGWLDKREDLTLEDRNSVLDYLDNIEAEGVNLSTLQLATGRWFAKGVIRLPEDMPKVRQAVKVAQINKADALKYNSPMEVIDTFNTTEIKEKPINPDDVPTLHKAKELDNGITIYDVDSTQESRENMRKIINTHFGKDASPWCLLQGDENGNLTKDSEYYWNRKYNAYPKQVAFVNGKLNAFSANDSSKKVWWDRQNKPNNGILVTEKLKDDVLGRRATYEFNLDINEKELRDYHKGNKQNGHYQEWNKDGILISDFNYKNGKQLGENKYYYDNGVLQKESVISSDGYSTISKEKLYYPNGQIRIERTMEDGYYLIGEYKTWYDNGQLESVATYNEDGVKIGEELIYYSNGQLRNREIRDEDGKYNGVQTYYYVNGQVKSIRTYLHGVSNGSFEEFTEDGFRYIYEEYKNNKLHGINEEYYKDSRKLRYRHTYVNDKLNGLSTHYDIYGNKTISLYKDGKKNGHHAIYDKNDVLIKYEHYKDDVPHGESIEYFSDGSVWKIYNFKDGQKDGVYKIYNPKNLNLLREGYYKDGKPDGILRHFYDNGSLWYESIYKDGHNVRTTAYDENGNVILKTGGDDVAFSVGDSKSFTIEEIKNMETPILRSKGTFKNFDEAEKWAKENLQGKGEVNEATGVLIKIGGRAIKEMLNPNTTNKINAEIHKAALKNVLEFIKYGIPAEVHPDTHGNPYNVMRLYNAITINDAVYRVKSTIKILKEDNRFYTYEMQNMEFVEDTQINAVGLNDSSRSQLPNSISGAKLLKGVKKTNSEEFILTENQSTKRVSPQQDVDYLGAVKSGDMKTAQKMVDEAVKEAMPNTKVVDEKGNPLVVYHGTNWKVMEEKIGKAVFDNSKGESHSAIPTDVYFFTSSRDNGLSYTENANFDVKQVPIYKESANSWIDENTEKITLIYSAKENEPIVVDKIPTNLIDVKGNLKKGYKIELRYIYKGNGTWYSRQIPLMFSSVVVNSGQSVNINKLNTELNDGFSDYVAMLLSGQKEENLINAYINLTNPIVIDYSGDLYRESNPYGKDIYDTIDYAKEHGYDGIILKNIRDGHNILSARIVADDVIAFSPNQIKSADPITYDDNGNVIPLSERFNEVEDDIRFKIDDSETFAIADDQVSFKVADKERAEWFENEPKIKVYQSAMKIDGKYYPAVNTYTLDANGNKVLPPEIKLKVVQEAEEHPERIAKEGKNKGKFPLKTQRGNMWVAYNPYGHFIREMLNDQFTAAHSKPELVLLETLIPASELTSGYRAEGAKNTTGEMPWREGPVSSQLHKLGRPRKVILSRWWKPIGEVDPKDVALGIKEMLDGTGITMPINVVTPQVREELHKIGVKFSAIKGSVGQYEEGLNKILKSYNEPQGEDINFSVEAERKFAQIKRGDGGIDKTNPAYISLKKKLESELGVHITEYVDPNRKRGYVTLGTYNTVTGEVKAHINNIYDINTFATTIIHEVVGHKGLRAAS